MRPARLSGRPPITTAALLLLALLAPAMVWPVPARIQDPEDRAEVVVAVLPEIRALLPPGRAALDPEPFCTPRMIGWNCPTAIHETAEELGFTLNSREFTLICLRGPTSCRLVAVRSLVAFDQTEVDRRAGRATVVAGLWWRGEAGASAVSFRRARYSLGRGRGGWVVRQR